jgi:hypothetical protein
VAGELFCKAAELRQQVDSEVSVYCTVSFEDLKGYSEACDITSPTTSAHNLSYQLQRAIRDQYTVSTLLCLHIKFFQVTLYQTALVYEVVSHCSANTD